MLGVMRKARFNIETSDPLTLKLAKQFPTRVPLAVNARNAVEAVWEFGSNLSNFLDFVGDAGVYNFNVSVNGEQFGLEVSAIEPDVTQNGVTVY
jgi:hypothetical protein